MTEESPKPLPYQSTIERFPEYAQTIGMISIEILLKIHRIVTAVMKETAMVFRSWPPYASQEIPRGQPQSENNPSERPQSNTPQRASGCVRLSNADRLAFVWLYGLCPSVVDAARLSDG